MPAGLLQSCWRCCAQGSQLAGSNGNKVGVEGAPVTPMDSVIDFLNEQRASLRQEAQHTQAAWRKADAKVQAGIAHTASKQRSHAVVAYI